MQYTKLGVMYYQTKSQMTVWPRDFCVVAAARPLDTPPDSANSGHGGGGFLLAARSVRHAAVPEAAATHVRAELMRSGFQLRALSDGGTHVTYVFQGRQKKPLPTLE